MIDKASEHPDYKDHPGLGLYGIESYIAVPLERRDGSVFGTLCALDPRPSAELEDKLELFDLLADLIAFQLESEELGEERERFLGVLGHDLRSPLQAITLSAYTALHHPERPAPLTRPLESILRGAGRIESMVGDLLDFARGRFGVELTLELEEVDVRELAERVVDEMRASHPGRDLRFESHTRHRARWDAGRVTQMLSNLVSNALAHGEVGSPVTVRAELAGDRVRFEVHNFGPPIPTRVMTKIFEPFSRAAETEAGSRSGLGLGLYIAQQVARAHRGSVAVTSSAEDGTRFVATLPA